MRLMWELLEYDLAGRQFFKVWYLILEGKRRNTVFYLCTSEILHVGRNTPLKVHLESVYIWGKNRMATWKDFIEGMLEMQTRPFPLTRRKQFLKYTSGYYCRINNERENYLIGRIEF